ncbi:type III-B CRISPR module RAMP protein Cmr1 [Pelotomaculum terephthalicicum JT]|uniref:type III-B CRISPR module RAMP protein Cmr1 n=1 Tax=Pelotomaculum TaxID=191373 RepID=UPI0009C5C108|nr:MULTISPECIES: type III-B CRISPR module RAMP protein Cmr1 [Pelotomaculum]MCG9968436.1 type III-B CRISPR module RAMP protein Cmr1 [Pelotomaculum terephthalicicum JT]OPX87188.1 MAG: hypothetical protein A4E54_01787 [Pelotomaculum sp. PtaB.Bin117]OPY60872.1 MAG: hypothetical protein A4E56_02409 [Pelotomaculum sp. PtaU1.Bin065]
MKRAKKIETIFKVTTPMFMAGNSQQQAEFRIPSLLGALRFWYRATAPGNLALNIPALRKAEAKLFGSTGTGQAGFLVRANSGQITIADADKARWAQNKHGICYLGYGAMNFRGEVQRNYIQEGSTISISFIFRPPLKDADVEGLQRAIKALSLFGGMGSRSRRGFGSVTLTSLKDEEGKELWRPPRTREELHNAIREFITSIGIKNIAGLPVYTAFTSSSRIILSKTSQNPINLLDSIGREMIRYRSYGRRNKDGDHTLPGSKEKAEQFFAPDHDLLLSLNQNPDPGKHPRRVAFGLPHNYFFGSTQVDITGEQSERRASPLFIHIHQLEKEYAAVLACLPAKFLPDGEHIKMVVRKNKQILTESKAPCNFDPRVISDFLARIPEALEVVI